MNTSSQENLTTYNSEQLHVEQIGVPQAVDVDIVIADNASIDFTWNIAQRLTHDFPTVIRAVRLNRKGRGLALKVAWSQSLAAVQAYMDVDLSTDIRHTPELVNFTNFFRLSVPRSLLDEVMNNVFRETSRGDHCFS